MAKNHARRRDDALGKSGRARREVGRNGSHSNTKHRDPAAVRRQRALDEDPRLRRAREERERHEAELRALEAQVNGTPHTPYQQQVHDYVERTTREQGVPFHVEDPETIAKVAALWVPARKKETAVVDTPPSRETEPAPISWSVSDARALIKQGYHVERVVKMTGVPVEQLKSLVGADGYARGL
jgi:hypothetical protein